MVPGPGIVERSLIESDPPKVDIQPFHGGNPADVSLALVYVTSCNNQSFKSENIICYLHIAFKNFFKFIPFSVAVRPCKLNAVLTFPFCR